MLENCRGDHFKAGAPPRRIRQKGVHHHPPFVPHCIKAPAALLLIIFGAKRVVEHPKGFTVQ